MNRRGVATIALAAWCVLTGHACDAPHAQRDAGDDQSAPRHHALVQQKVGFYATFLPPDYDTPRAADRRYPVCVILHGRGSTELNHGQISNHLGRDDVIYVAPRAPHAYHDIFLQMRQPGFSAWPSYPEAWGEWNDEGFPQEEMAQIDPVALYVQWVADTLADVRRRYRTDGDKVLVFGHSEGAAFAFSLAVRRPDLVRALFAYAGYYNLESLAAETAARLKKHDVFPVIAHAEGDEVVSVGESRKLVSFLEAHEVPHRAAFFEGGDHALGPEPQRAAREFLRDRCCSADPASAE